jgi:hypothetical protein
MNKILQTSDERTLLVTTAPDLERAIRNVVSEFLAEKQESTDDVKVSRAAAAKRLRKTPMTLTRWEKAGKIHPIRIGRSIYYAESEVKRLEEGKQ